MKQFISISKLFFFIAVLGFITSCEPEVIINDPSVSLVDEAGFISADATVNAGDTFTVKLSADKGDGEMNSLTILKDNVNLPTSDFQIDGAIANNPKLLFDGDRTGFTYEVAITAPVDAGTSVYTFKVDSDDTGSNSTSIEITVDETNTPPALSNDMNASIELVNPSTVKIVLSAAKGTSPLNTITVAEEGTIIADLTRLSWGATEFIANPNLLEGADKDGFVAAELFLKSQNTIGTTNYTITLTDEAGNESAINYAITLLTPISDEFNSVSLFNNAGAMFGAVDLPTGTNVSSTTMDGDIVDLGNDGSDVWRMQIGAVTGTSLRTIDASYTYDNVTSKETLQAAYDAGTEVTETPVLGAGSVFTASKDGVLYLIEVESVNPTSGDDNDAYTLNIKKAE